MHAAIAPTLAIGSVESLRRVTDHPWGSDGDRHEAELLAGHFLYSRGLFQEAMRTFQGWLSEGADARQIGRDAEMTLEAIDSYLVILATSLPPHDAPPLPQTHLFAGLPTDRLRELREAYLQVHEIRVSLSRLLDLLGAPRPPVDWQRVHAAEAELDRGEREDLADIVARLEAGEDL